MNLRVKGNELIESGRCFSVAMWEYSWMLQRQGAQDEYADWDLVLDEAVARGYECLRIDAFPHLIAGGEDGTVLEETTVTGNFNHMWTNFEPVRVHPRRDLVAFMKKMKERGLYAGLSSWYRFDEHERELLVRRPEDYARIWIETLDVLAEADLLDIVVWVDLCNEFLLPFWCIGPAADILGTEVKNDQPKLVEDFIALAGPWSPEIVTGINRYLTQPIDQIRERYPQLKYTFSFSDLAPEKCALLDFSRFDLLEPHIWAVMAPGLSKKTRFLEALAGEYPYGVFKHMREWISQHEENSDLIRESLEGSIRTWAAIARERDLPLVTSECWSTVMYEDLLHSGALGEWEPIKRDGEIGVALAIENGWQGIATSNFCEPHFEGMWREVAWHREMTSRIRRDGEGASGSLLE